jgi:hypothetical protein
MKKQILDTIIYNEIKYELQESPLYPYLVKLGYNPFFSPGTNCTKGYLASWEIRNDELFLINFKGFIRRKNKVGLEYLFPNKTEVLAKWFNETIKIDLGDSLGYLVDRESIFKQVIFLDFEKGVQKEMTVSKKNYIDLIDKKPPINFGDVDDMPF